MSDWRSGYLNYPSLITLPSPASVQLAPEGRFGGRFYGNLRYIQYLHDRYGEEMLEAYASPHYAPGRLKELAWDREYAGKWLDAAVFGAAIVNGCKLEKTLFSSF